MTQVDREWLRFWKRVRITDGGCWLWTGSHDDRGYGRFWSNETNDRHSAHRWLWERLNGAIVERLQLDHRCENPSCVNPEHLEPVTAVENIRRKFGSVNTDSTRCRKGHLMEGENLYVSPKGLRFCKACRRTTLARFEERKRVDRAAKRDPGKPTPPKAPPPSERTHCPQGHAYEGENLRINAEGRRVCAECQREANRRAREKRRAEAGPPQPQRSANAEKTHCPNGHAYEGDNLIVENGARRCRTCRREASRRAYLKRKQQI